MLTEIELQAAIALQSLSGVGKAIGFELNRTEVLQSDRVKLLAHAPARIASIQVPV
jgi:hypothetical protein